ncbi:uncharacterized protein LOC124136243 [Haliotis rufescens]|uniref:uncharacterized protein LOC124136243 n=1 Tax=Haliotis rufescens TaxID=6454 RepID=UPI00201F3D0D|nr:uncharacterized protein LOC124136243 [Haliotis rufescens]
MSNPQSAGSRSKTKRRHLDVDAVSSDDETIVQNPDSWPRFLVVEGLDGNPLKVNPFIISKAIEGICGNVKNVTRLRSGSLLVECARRQQSINLLNAHHFANTEIVVSEHKSLNSCKGIVRDRSKCLSDMSEEDIVAELKPQGVIAVKRFTRKEHDNIIKTHTYLFTFALSSLPKSLKAGYFNLGVDIFVPSPLRCFKCQQFGHGARFCRNSPVCSRCSEKHDSTDCTNVIKCANCNGEHMSSSKLCPKFERESKINTIKYTNNISFSDAKKLVAELSHPNPSSKSYSATVSSSISKVAAGCQTAISWISDKQTLLFPICEESASSETQTEIHLNPLPETQTDSLTETQKAPLPETQPMPRQKANLSKSEKKSRKKELRALKHVAVPVPLTTPVEVHNPYEPLQMDVTPQLIGRSDNSPRSPIEPP